MSQVRVHNFAISLDGFGTGDGLTLEAPFGHAGERLHEWMFTTRFWHAMRRRGRWQHGHRPRLRRAARARHRRRDHGPWQVRPAAGGAVDRRRHRRGVARLVGAEPAVPHAGVRAHPPPAPADRDGGRHHLPLRRRQPAGGARRWPVRRPTTSTCASAAARRRSATSSPPISSTSCHVVQVPILLGRGVRLWDGLEGLEERYDIEVVSAPSGVAHMTITRR